MRIRFTKDIIIWEHYNIDCFGGFHSTRENHFKAGDEIEVRDIERGEKRRHAPRLNLILRAGTTMHPDRLLDVPEDCYEEVEP